MVNKILEKEREERKRLQQEDWEFHKRKAERILKLLEKSKKEEKERIQRYYNKLLQKK